MIVPWNIGTNENPARLPPAGLLAHQQSFSLGLECDLYSQEKEQEF